MPHRHENATSSSARSLTKTAGTIAERITYLEDRQKDTQRKVDEVLRFLGEDGAGLQHSFAALKQECVQVKDEMIRRCDDSMKSQNDVIRRTGMKIKNLKEYADAAIERAINETRQYVEKLSDEILPIKDAVKEFKTLEKEMARQFNAHSSRAERITEKATKCKEEVERYKDEIEDLSLTASIDNLKADNTMLREELKRLNPYAECAAKHATAVQQLEATIKVSRFELKNLAENVAAGGTNKMTDAQLIENAQRASKLLKTRPLSEPPPRRRESIKPNTLKPSEEKDDITKWHKLLALVQENTNNAT